MNKLNSDSFRTAKSEIDKIVKNEAGADARTIAECGKAILDLIGGSPREFSGKDRPTVDALRKAVCETTRSNTLPDAEVYEYLRVSAATLRNIRTVKRKPRENASRLCGRIADWLFSADEASACREGATMPTDTPFVEART